MSDTQERDDVNDLFGPPANDTPVDWTTVREIWTVTQIATEMQIDTRTVRYWCAQGLLKARTTHGGHYRVEARDLRLYLNGHADPLSVAA